MKGLLLKDWYMILKYCRAFLVILVIFMGVSAVSESALFFALYPMISGHHGASNFDVL